MEYLTASTSQAVNQSVRGKLGKRFLIEDEFTYMWQMLCVFRRRQRRRAIQPKPDCQLLWLMATLAH